MRIIRFLQQRVMLVGVITAVFSLISVLIIVVLPNAMFDDRILGFEDEIKLLAENHLNSPEIDDNFSLFIYKDGVATLETSGGFISNIDEELEQHLVMWGDLQVEDTKFYKDYYNEEEYIYYIVVVDEGYYVVTYYNIADVHSLITSFKQLSGAVIVVLYLASIVVLSIFVNSKFVLHVAYYDTVTKFKTKYALFTKFHKKKLGMNDLTYIAISNWENIIESCGPNNSDMVKKAVGKTFESLFIKESIYQLSDDSFLIVADHKTENDKLEKMFNSAFMDDSHLKSYTIKLKAITIDEELITSYDPDSIVKRFEIAYEEIRNTKASTMHIDEDMLEKMEKVQYYQTRLLEAIENGLITNFYQIKVNPKTNKAVGCESLSRWVDGDVIIAPDNYIGIAESSGYIFDIDMISLRNSCRLIRKLVEKGLMPEGFKVSTNFSPLTLKNVKTKDIKAMLDKYNVHPSMISIEITESIMLEIDKITKTLDEIKEMGLSIEIDDFSAGNSSFSVLPILKASVVKIDRMVLPNLKDEKEKVIYESLVNLSKRLDLKVTSEGVETKKVSEYLRGLNVDAIQGYYYSKPVEWRSFLRKIKKYL